MKTTSLLQKTLVDHGYKITRPRELVFEAFRGQPPLTMAELIGQLGGNVDRVTIYRTVALFEKLDIINRIAVGWKYKLELGDVFSEHHHHITCLDCGHTVAVRESDQVEQLIDQLGQDSGFFAISHQLELQGYCKNCKNHHR